jgi:hypothetical protein
MTAILITALIVSLLIAGSVELSRWLRDDGGPRHDALPRTEDGWSAKLHTRPYALR